MPRAKSEGVCHLCNQPFAKNAMTRHLQSCAPAHDPPRGRKGKIFHVIVEGYGPYWLHVEMPGNAKFGDLDAFLRQIWLECCGHMSAFRMDEKILRRFDLDIDSPSELEFPEDELMDYDIAEVLEPKLAFGYDYDFGSTTELRLKVAGMRTGTWSGRDRIRLLARNLPPQDNCQQCGQPAAWIDGESGNFYCATCADADEEPEMLLPVVNSPRMGVCAYTGEEE